MTTDPTPGPAVQVASDLADVLRECSEYHYYRITRDDAVARVLSALRAEYARGVETAAKACEEIAATRRRAGDYEDVAIATECAAAIRALKPKEAPHA